MPLCRKPHDQVLGPGTTYPPGASRSGGTPSRGVFASGASQQTSMSIAVKAMVRENGGSDRLEGAVPMVTEPGDVVVCNRRKDE